jgi:60 kDa SS-A/Ro ribonucleoprotein
MSKFNQKPVPTVTPTITHQGGYGFTQRPEQELIGLLSTGIQNSYYEKESEREIRLKSLIDSLAIKNKTFVAKALIYARTVFNQRTVTHLGAVNLLPHLSGDPLGKRFFSKRSRKENKGGIVYRLDDMLEILACYEAKNGIKPKSIDPISKWTLPKAIKIGFKDAIEHADMYELAKYQAKSSSISLVDIVNLVHPKQTTKNGFVEIGCAEYKKVVKGTKWDKEEMITSEKGTVKISALRALVLGLLKQFNTVEDKNTEAGKVVSELVKSGKVTKNEAEQMLVEKKTENYEELISTKKIGYLALLRNVRNILKTDNDLLLNNACELLVNKDFILKSKVFPHQIDIALEVMLLEFSGVKLAKIAKALNEAYELSIPNLAELFNEGKTAVVLDVSGSMSSMICLDSNKRGSASALQKGALIGATLAKGIGSDMFVFADRCAQVRYNPLDSINTFKTLLMNGNCVGGGTSWSTIFPYLEAIGKYDRVFIISDEQGADNVERSYTSYCNKFGTPHVYVINICGYGPTMMKQTTRVHRIFGYNSDIYETAKKVEMDVNAVIKEINVIEI